MSDEKLDTRVIDNRNKPHWSRDDDWKPKKLPNRKWDDPIIVDPYEYKSIYKRPVRKAPILLEHTLRTKDLELKAAAALIIEKADWEIFATLTHRHDISAVSSFENFTRFCSGVARTVVRGHVWVAWTMARQRLGRIHYHALLARYHQNTEPLDTRAIGNLWYYGERPKIETVGSYGAALYLAKHQTWDLNVACDRPRPCRRKHGCRLAPGPWPTGKGNVLAL